MIMWPVFMSVRWKLWAPFLLALSCIHLSLYSYFGFQLEQHYERDQQVSVNSNLKALDGVLTTSYHKLLEVGQTILLMKQADPHRPDQVPYQEFVRSSITEKYPQFEAQGILDAAAVFDAQGRLMFSAGINIKSNSGVLSALKAERPVREMSCDDQCFRSIAIPLLNAGKVKGVLVLGRLMQDMMLDFRQLTSVEIGFARTNIEKPTDIVAWSLDFTQLTQRNRNIQILQSLSQQVETISNETLYRVEGFDRHYDVFFTVPESVALTNTVWVLIADGTNRYQDVSALKNQLGFGLIVSALLLLLIAFMSASSLTRRLMNVTSFTKGQGLAYADGSAKALSNRHQITDVGQESLLFQDEIAEASRWISDISNKLDRLSESEFKANQRLDDMAQALRMEKERVAHLVGNSENIIVTQSTDGIVLTINDVGKKLFHLAGEGGELPDFTGLFFAGDLNQEALDGINRLYMGLGTLVCTDSQSLDSTGQLRYFTWIHSYISECPMHRAIILSIGMDVTEKREAEKRLGWLLLQYPITEVANKDFFLKKLPEVMEESLRDERSLAVLCCDVKRLNDSYLVSDLVGHETELSTAVAGRISSCLREDDIVARFDDETFMVILKGIKTSDSGGSVAQQIITAFSVPFCLKDSEAIVGINIGISIFPEQAATATNIIGCAELAMQMSRDLGVNSYQYYRVEQPSTNEHSETYID